MTLEYLTGSREVVDLYPLFSKGKEVMDLNPGLLDLDLWIQ